MHTAADPLPAGIFELSASPDDSLSAILELAKSRWGATELDWSFDRNLITSIQCTGCGRVDPFVGTEGLFASASFCSCGSAYKPQFAESYNGSQAWGMRSFRELGFPQDHIYCAVTPSDRVYFVLQ